ncbi:hypothetical protein AY599_06655 [Leptolyngbya valderiana BDU 20041]|nr:hypothetical protein AY599_06655 [Leptolyngbya valderiana BDU 20041]
MIFDLAQNEPEYALKLRYLVTIDMSIQQPDLVPKLSFPTLLQGSDRRRHRPSYVFDIRLPQYSHLAQVCENVISNSEVESVSQFFRLLNAARGLGVTERRQPKIRSVREPVLCICCSICLRLHSLTVRFTLCEFGTRLCHAA